MNDRRVENVFSSSDYNECVFILTRLCEMYPDDNRRGESRSLRGRYSDARGNGSLCSSINRIIKGDISKVRVLKKEYELKKQQVFNETLEWVSHNKINKEESIFYLWFSIRLFVSVDSRGEDCFDFSYSNLHNGRRRTIEKIFRDEPASYSIALSNILTFYFYYLCREPDVIELMNKIHYEWKLDNIKPSLRWLKKDDDAQCHWAYSYLSEKSDDFFENFKADQENKYFYIKTFYLLFKNRDSVKYIFSEMNKTWNQRRYREARAEKKSLSGYISQDAKLKLTEMAKKARMPEYELLELLILEHYDREGE